jgi:hypothetical protein
MHSAASTADPCPDIPPSFRGAACVPQLARELSRHVQEAAGATDAVAETATADAAGPGPTTYRPPRVARRKVLAARRTGSGNAGKRRPRGIAATAPAAAGRRGPAARRLPRD